MKKISTLFIALFITAGLMAQSSAQFWKDIQPTAVTSATAAKNYLPTASGRTLSLDVDALQSYLKAAPMEFTAAAPLELQLPNPDGSMTTFGIYEIRIMAEGLAAAFPNIKTYAGVQEDKESVFTRITTGPLGFHATIYNGTKTEIIESIAVGETAKYMSYHLADAADDGPVSCGQEAKAEELIDELSEHASIHVETKSFSTPVSLRTYRLAVSTTVEYSLQNGNTPTSVLNAVTSVVNQVNGIFEKDNAIRFELIDNTDEAFYFNSGGQDPFTNGEAGVMILENPPVLNSTFGADAYDIGHVFGTAQGAGVVGLASLGVVCTDDKGRGVSNVLGPNFFFTVTHEIGHQFNATHTFNFCDGDNESPGTGYEPGGGTTIMAYAGACMANSVANSNDPYFHNNSMERILAFSTGLTGSSCANEIATSNNTPEASIPLDPGFLIPISTPFELTGEATDTEMDVLSYCWEQYDLGPPSPLGSPNPTGTPPLFRSYPPTDTPTRIFPRIQTIVGNSSDINEVLPTTSRDLTFRFTVRDCNAEAGGYGYDEIKFGSTTAAGPFLVSAPNDGTESWTVGDYKEVTWDVAGTDGPQVDCQFVNIYLSIDGGFTYPITLLANTKNDGSAFVVVPDEVTNNARIKVKSANNVFFDISNNNFSIEAAVADYFVVSSYGPECGDVCLPATFTATFSTVASTGFAEMINFDANGLPAGAVAVFSPNPVTAGETTTMSLDMSAVTASGLFSITVTADANGFTTQERIVELNALSSDFSALELMLPKGSGNSILPNYEWSSLPNAATYEIEVATDLAFTNIVDAAADLGSNVYSSGATLEENTIYFWRVRASNECGTGEYVDGGAFRTISQACTTYPSTDVTTIPSGNGNSVTAIINVPGGTVDDINIRNITGQYNAFGDLTFDLISPLANTVRLMNQQPCGSATPFNFGFDDESPVSNLPCPPVDGTTYKPSESMDVFLGDDAAGDWGLQISVVTNFGAGGTLDTWDLEICGAFEPIDPVFEVDSICALPGGMDAISPVQFLVTDVDNTPSELVITIITTPDNGEIMLNGTVLGEGDSFTMQDINSSAVVYNNVNSSATTDEFSFYVEEVSGGFIGIETAHIDITTDCVVSTRESLLDASILNVYPNPATDVLNIALTDTRLGMEQVSLFNAQGQLIMDRLIAQQKEMMQLNIQALPTGIYLVQVRTENGIATKKVLID